AGERSTAVTVPPRRAVRRANGSASRPGPQPYSRIFVGAKSGASRSCTVRQRKSTSASPPAKNSSRAASVRAARRKRGSVRTVKYGSSISDQTLILRGGGTGPTMDVSYDRSSMRVSAAKLTGVACVSGSVLLVELGITRLFSVITWSHFAFLAVSLALFGL